MKQTALKLMSRAAPHLLATAGKGRLSILIYHRVLSEPDPLRPGEPTVSTFDWQMRLLRGCFNPLPLQEAVRKLRDGSLPERAVCVTFDDGYSDNEALALPVLARHGIPATVFVSTGFLDGGRMFNDSVIETVRALAGGELDLRECGLGAHSLRNAGEQRAAIDSILLAVKHREPNERLGLIAQIESFCSHLPNDLMMTSAQVKRLSAGGVSIGAHTVNHPILLAADDVTAREEIAHSKKTLEQMTQVEVNAFAYPNGKPGQDYALRHREMVDELGFDVAVSTHHGVATTESDVLQLPRFTPWDQTESRFAVRLLLNYRNPDPLPEEHFASQA